MRVKLPDGKIALIPDDLSEEDKAKAKAKLQEMYPPGQRELTARETYLKNKYDLPRVAFEAAERRGIPVGASQPIDTRTGKPMRMTTPYAAMQSAKHHGVMDPIVGDVAANLIVPQEQLATGARLASKVGPAVRNLFRRTAATGVGSGAGSMVGQSISDGEIDSGEVATEVKWGIGGEIATSLAFPLIGKIAKATGKLAAMTGGKVTGLTDKAYQHLQRLHNDLRRKFMVEGTQKAEDFIRTIGGPGTDDAAYEIGQTLTSMKNWDEVYQKANALIKKAETEGENGKIVLDGVQQTLGELVEKLSDIQIDKPYAIPKDKWNSALNDTMQFLGFSGREAFLLRSVAEGWDLDARDAQYLLKRLWKGSKNWEKSKYVRNWLETFKDSFIHDIEKASPGYAKAQERADAIFKNTMDWFDTNPVAKKGVEPFRMSGGKTIFSQEKPEIYFKILAGSSPERLADLKAAVLKRSGGFDAWSGFKLAFVRNLYDTAIREAQDTGRRWVQPFKLSKNILDNEKRIKAVAPELWPKLEKEAKYFAEIAPDFEQISVRDNWGLFEAWGHLDKDAKKALARLSKGTDILGTTLKMGTKGTMHIEDVQKNMEKTFSPLLMP